MTARCLGSSQYLKEKFGMGYTFETKIDPKNDLEFFELVQQLFSDRASIFESFSNRYVYNVPKDCIKSLARVFEKLENGKIRFLFI